ncbi:helix-turn-helix domain-containing protein [Allopusillimonas ginsengisoli]|uniref:helix-turn-helix domain-containing protein n=1 Tax=Allopusillimonas ginsengisoli TaxID=453575 RepID=UPI0010216EDF|nr:helix-turn-helix domain-containing protein [Allopusillimonas ginsengisoli]TEA79123.1 helix-turn-helix domain-containing protein [Allopusillimonas ginsengisoli]
MIVYVFTTRYEVRLMQSNPYPALMSRSAVILFVPADTSNARLAGRHRIAELESYGLAVSYCADMPQLYRTTRQSMDAGATTAAVLSGDHNQNCTVAAHLRALHPLLGIVALTQSESEAMLLQCLHSGVDHFCPARASSQLLSALLFRLLWRLDVSAAARAAAGASAVWSLPEQAWILASPEGKRIALTTGERAFLMALLAAPNQRAAHADLISAVNEAYKQESVSALQSRLSVLVSRLRRKCAEHGAGLPLKSVHNWGYMFTGPVSTG